MDLFLALTIVVFNIVILLPLFLKLKSEINKIHDHCKEDFGQIATILTAIQEDVDKQKQAFQDMRNACAVAIDSLATDIASLKKELKPKKK